MKMKWVAAAVIGMGLSTSMMANAATGLVSEEDKLSYSIGADLGKNFKQQGIPVNSKWLAKGINDAMSSSAKPLLTAQQMQETLNKFQKDVMAKRLAEANKKGEANKLAGEQFLKANKSKEGVVTLASGLQYKIITKGAGKKPGKDDMVTVEYTGKLLNGQVFDSTDKTGKPVSFKLSQVIPGWTEALQLMPAGSTWELYIPSELAYGSRAMGGPIGPNETLMFNVHLVSINDKATS